MKIVSYWSDEYDPGQPAPLGVLVALGGGFDEELDTEGLAKEFSELTAGSRISVAQVDPYVGAGGYGVAFLWDIASKGADLFAWVMAAKAVAPHVRRVADAAKERFREFTHGSPVCFTPAAIEALYLADLAEREPTEMKTIVDVQTHRFGPQPAEPREELLHLYAAYTITVTSVVDEMYRVRVALLNSQATLIAEIETAIPIPNASHWGDRPVKGRPLYDGPWQTK